MQAARTMSGSADYPDRPEGRESSSSIQPLMIEFQNGRYVRVNSATADSDALPLTLNPNSQPAKPTRPSASRVTTSNSTPQPPPITIAPPAHDLPPAILIFRDGTTEEVRDYTIADGILYARGDYYNDGYWNKRISLSALNIAETLRANAGRNVKFALPSSPNEVITRP
jgi:hypothetical protein